MKIIIPGGTGQVGAILARAFQTGGHEVIILSRKAEKSDWRIVRETELVLKSRRVVPTRLLESGFEFEFPDWESAAQTNNSAQFPF